jgi:hypothetical protein
VYTPAELRERLGLPRRLAVPVLEHADEVGVTLRRPDGRVRGPAVGARGPAAPAGTPFAS